MYDTLTAINLAPGTPCLDLPVELRARLFEMSTCQRRLFIGLGVWPDKALAFLNDRGRHGLSVHFGTDAYIYLLEVITGLKSRLLGESEVAGQFKKAYDQYKRFSHFNSVTGQIIEKLMRDGKEIKCKYLQSIGQYSYAGLAKRVLQKNFISDRILIVGTGALARDTGTLLGKYDDLSFTGRNQEKLEEICKKFDRSATPWLTGLENFSAIINTVGAEEILFGPTFFEQWNHKIFIDLGRPSVIQTSKGVGDGVYRLEDLVTLGQRFDEAKLLQIQKAHQAIHELTHKRFFGAFATFPFGWEELNFA